MGQTLKKDMLYFGNRLIEKGLVTGTGGNISLFLRDRGEVLITPSGMAYEELVPEDIVTLDLQGKVLSGERKPSIEWGMHCAIYRARLDVSAVIHTHSCYASAIAITRQDFPPVLDAMAIVFGGGIKTAVHTPVGTATLADNVVEALGSRPAALLANHGAVGIGANLKEAFGICELLEACAKSYLFANLAGRPVILDEKEILAEQKDVLSRYGQQDGKKYGIK